MNKTYLSIVLGACLAATSVAAPVSFEEASETARGYVAFSDGEVLGGTIRGPVSDSFPIVADDDGTPVTVGYGFNFANGGWVIVSADDRVEPVVGYNSEGFILKDDFDNPECPVQFIVVQPLLNAIKAFDHAENEPALAPPADDSDDGEPWVSDAEIMAPRAADARARRNMFRAALPSVDEDGIVLPRASVAVPTDLRVNTLCATRWHQSGHGENYYSQKYMGSVLGRVVSGCTQTALGQVFYYLRWPRDPMGTFEIRPFERIYSYGTFTNSYLYQNGERIPGDITAVVNANGRRFLPRYPDSSYTEGGAGYQWDLMWVNSNSPYPDEEGQKALGALLWDIAFADGADFTPGSTGANPSPKTLMVMFGYANMRQTAVGSLGEVKQSSEQAEALKNGANCNLDAGIPCQLSGFNSGGSAGHAVVIDGYGFGSDGQTGYHINFGWGGSADGWYTWNGFGSYSFSSITFNIFTNCTGEIISGRVLDSNNAPIVGATIDITETSRYAVTNIITKGKKTEKQIVWYDNEPEYWGSVTSGNNGIWAAVGVKSNSKVTATVSKPGYSFSTSSQTKTMGESASYSRSTASCGNVWGVNFTGVNEGTAYITGTVLTTDGNPFVGAQVQFGTQTVTVDATGHYTLEVPKEVGGTLTVLTANDGCSPASISVSGSELPSRATLTKNFTVTYSLARAVDQPTWSFQSQGANKWSVVFDEAKTVASAKSATMDANSSLTAESRLSATVTGPGIISFYVKSQFERGLYFYYDGGPTNIIGAGSGTKSGGQWHAGAWTYCEYPIPTGTHTLYWDVGCSGSNASGCPNVGWLDQIYWMTGSDSTRVDVDSARGDTYSTGTVVGTIWSLGGAASGTLQIEYSTSSDFSNPTVVDAGTKTDIGGFQVQLAGLSMNTTYYARAKFTPAGGSTVTSNGSVSFRTPDGNPPGLGTMELKDYSVEEATITVPITNLGDASSRADILVEVIDANNQVASTATLSVTEPGSYDIRVDHLLRDTPYTVRVTATSSLGKSVTRPGPSFRTMDGPEFLLDPPYAVVETNGTAATIYVNVYYLNVTGTLSLFVNDQLKKTWNCTPSDADLYSFPISVEPGSTNQFRFVGTGTLGVESTTTTVSGFFVATVWTGWFDVKLGSSVYSAGSGWAGAADPTGHWTASPSTHTVLVDDAEPYVEFDDDLDEEVRFTPNKPSETDADVEVKGRVRAVSGNGIDPMPSDAVGALKFVEGEGEFILPAVYDGAEWHPFGTGGFLENDWVDYKAEFNIRTNSPARIRMTVGALESDWIDLVSAPRKITAVAYEGGAFADVKGIYWSLYAGSVTIPIPSPEITTVGTGTTIISQQGQVSTFSLSLAEVKAGFWYTLVTSETLEGPYAPEAPVGLSGFTVQNGSVYIDHDQTAFALPILANTPSKFAKIVVSTEPLPSTWTYGGK